MARQNRQEKAKSPAEPLGEADLRALAIRYVERFQTSSERLRRYLERKLYERSRATDQPERNVEAIVADMVARHYIDDEAFADARARSLARKGFGPARIGQQLHRDGIAAATRARLLEGADPWQLALDFARRKRLGPFGAAPPAASPDDRKLYQRQLAAFQRGGHAERLARRILAAQTIEELTGE